MLVRVSIFLTLFVFGLGVYFVGPWSSTAVLPSTESPKLTTANDRPCDPLALPLVHETLGRLAQYSRSPARILSGQNIGHASSDLFRSHYRTWKRLTEFRHQPEPAVMALDLGLNSIPDNASPIVKLVSPHVENGGLVSISMHPGNPWTEGDYDDKSQGRFQDLLTPGTPVNDRWLATLDRVAGILKDLQQQQICVLWRPLHEANGDWFWWCGGGEQTEITPERFQQLWKHMHHHLHTTHGLHNLIWVYSANVVTGPEVRPPLDFYPGDAFVDVVGLDYYGPEVASLNQSGCYSEIQRMGKVIALTEFGAKPMDGSLDGEAWARAMRDEFGDFSYFVFWHSWPDNLVSLADLDDVQAIMQPSWVHHRQLQPAR